MNQSLWISSTMGKMRARRIRWVSLFFFPILGGPLAAAGVSPATWRAPAWKPVSPQEQALRAPIVEPDADAEAIFWDVRVVDSLDVTNDPRTDTWNHVRVKVFTPRGKENWTRIDIPYEGRTRVVDLAARTIRSDGSIVEAGKDALSERTLVKAGGVKMKASSVAVPGVEVGSLIEYRWREIQPDHVSFSTLLIVEREIPIQRATFAFKPIDLGDWRMQTATFGVPPAPFSRDSDGLSVMSVTNVHSVAEEPFAPPADTFRAWILVTYTNQKDGASPDAYWRAFGRRVADLYKQVLKPGGDVRKIASAAIGDEIEPERRLGRLFDHCRTKIRNVDAPGSKVTREDRERLAKDDSPGSTLSRLLGTSSAVDIAFAALANAVGFEARLARVGDRSRYFFDPATMNPYFLNRLLVAVKFGEGWRFFSPGTPSVAFDELPWQAEDGLALLCDPKDSRFVRIPATPAERNTVRRNTRFRLDTDGTLDGTVTVEMSGQAAISRRAAFAEATPEEIERTIREEVTDRFSAAEISAVAVEGRDAPERPLVTTYKVRVPGFAARAGSRLLFPASWFRKGRAPRFPSSTRTQSVFFPYGSTDEDEITVELPEKFTAEELTAPPPIKILGSKGEHKVTVAQEGRTLTYRRSFKLAGGTFGVADYEPLKRAFDRIQSADERTITLAPRP